MAEPSHRRQPAQTSGDEVPPARQIGVLRILDAAANRASGGLRVVEDFLRFILDDRHLTGLCKQLRHDLAHALEEISVPDRYAARETRGDVGTDLTTSAEYQRADACGVLQANFRRVEQSLRSLEEYTKVIQPQVAARLEPLRYRTYTLARAAGITAASIDRLEGVRLYVLIGGRSSPDEFADLTRSLLEAGVGAFQLRDKQLDDRRLLDRARLLRRLTQEKPALFIVNDRADLAVLAGADGVHVGQEELSVKDVRTIVGPRMLIGVSTHSLGQARQAVLDGADYIGVGPTFASETKQFERFPGLALLREVSGQIRLPAFAIGGIDNRNLPAVLETGFTRMAVSGAVAGAEDAPAAARRLLATLGSS